MPSREGWASKQGRGGRQGPLSWLLRSQTGEVGFRGRTAYVFPLNGRSPTEGGGVVAWGGGPFAGGVVGEGPG
jgi:hypothetical protein